MNEWARLVDRYAAELKKYEGSYANENHLHLDNTNTVAANQRADEFLSRN